MKTLVVGMGSAIADAVVGQLVNAGHTVVGTYDPRIDTAAVISKWGDQVEMHLVDHGDGSQVDDFIRARTEQFDGLVFAHMYFNLENRKSFDFTEWSISVAHNYTALMRFLSNAESLLADDAGVVVVTSTEAFRGSFRAAAYASSKAAAHSLVSTAANNLGSRGIRVNAVAPGWIGGVMDTDEVFERSRQVTPLRRLGSPDEVAAPVLFLLSTAAAFVSGVVLVVDGGYLGVDPISQYEAESVPE